MDLKSFVSKEKTIEMEFPGIKEFKVTLAYLSKDEILKIRKKCISIGFNKQRQPEEKVDEELFSDIYTEKVVRGWTGLNFGHLRELLALEDSAELPADDTVVEFTSDNLKTLMDESSVFDRWVTEVISDVSNFN